MTGVYDGDSVTADVELGLGIWKHDVKLRLIGVDTPEMKGDTRSQAIVARDALRELILGKEVILCTDKDRTGKYGRYLAWLYFGNIKVNSWLKMKDFGKPY